MGNTQWLRCRAVAGQFSDEFAISGKDYAGQEYFLFTEKANIFPYPIEGEIDSFVRVEVIDSDGEFVLIKLPGQTLENGQTITVCRSELEKSPTRQEA
jgi:hypothetical protein